MRKMQNRTSEFDKYMELNELNKELNNRLGREAVDEAVPQRTRRRYREDSRKEKESKYGKTKVSRQRTSGKVRAGIIVLLVLLLLFAVLLGGLFAVRQMGKKSLTRHEGVENVEITAPEDVNLENEGHTVTYNGKKYRRNEDVISILCMGIDQESLQEEGRVNGENGQADTLFVVALDASTGGVKLVNISRDSMAEVDLYNAQNEYVKTEKMQICLAYAYGDGKESSCENTIKSVSRLLYGMPIDAYAAIDLPAISVLNDAIGGVEVEVLEDLTNLDQELVQGATVLLQGSQAEAYVRSRDAENPDASAYSNNARMERQKQYLSNFITKVLAIAKKDITVPLSLYQAITSYMVTDIDLSEITYLVTLIMENGFSSQNIINVPGETVMGEEFAEYHIDEDGLYQIILDVFYTEV